MAVNPPVVMNPPAPPPAIGSRWEVFGFDWSIERDRVLYSFVVIALSECGWALCRREDTGGVEPRYCAGQANWFTSDTLRPL